MRRSLVTALVVAALCWLVTIFVGPWFGFVMARIEGEAMAPTLRNQDRVLVNGWSYRWSSPRRGDIVMLRYPPDPSRAFVKRVIGAGGDSVRVEDGRVFVNDLPLDERYVASDGRSHDTHGPIMIPEGQYYVLGDRRNNSSDSRHWGLVPRANIVGRVALRWYPTVEKL
jgi:signal peptidase I